MPLVLRDNLTHRIMTRAVEAHEGTLTFRTKEGVGTMFTMMLPQK